MNWTLSIGTLSLGILDLVMLASLILGGLSGCLKGFAKSASHNVGFILACPLAMLFTRPLASIFSERLSVSMFLSAMIVFVCLSMIIYLLFSLLGGVLENVMEELHLDVLNAFLGFVWGLFSAALILSLIIAILDSQSIISLKKLLDSSIFTQRFIRPFFPSAWDMVTGLIRNGV